MKTSELLKLLKKHGCYIIGHGSNHDKYCSPLNGNTFIKNAVKPLALAMGI